MTNAQQSHPELADIYRPILLDAISQANAHTRAMLRRAIGKALDGIEDLCPVVLKKTGAGLLTAYGPRDEIAHMLMPVLVATPKRFTFFGYSEWPQPIAPSLRDAPGAAATTWDHAARGVEKRDLNQVSNAVAARITPGLIEEFRAFAEHTRAEGDTPLLLVMCARRQRKQGVQTCGVMSFLRLPPTIEAQLAVLEQNTQH
jgi:hypothetical protein